MSALERQSYASRLERLASEDHSDCWKIHAVRLAFLSRGSHAGLSTPLDPQGLVNLALLGRGL